MKKIHIPRKVYIKAVASFFILATLGSAAFFFIQVGEKWYDPVEISRIEIGEQKLSDIEINEEDGLIYVTKFYRGFDIYNITDPTNPTRTAFHANLGELNQRIYYADDRIFLSASRSLYIIDVSDPTSPERLGNFTTYESVQNVDVVGDILYLTTYNWFRVLDISNPANITILSSLQLHFGDHDVVVRDKIAFVASNLDGLLIFNVTDPSNPHLITKLWKYGTGVLYSVTRTKAVRLDGENLFVVDGVHGLVSFDITNISSPVKRFKYVSGPPPDYFAIQDDIAYYPNSHSGVEIVDISDPENIVVRGTTRSRYLTSAVVMYGEIAISISTEGVSLSEIVEGKGFNPWKLDIALDSLEGLWKGIGVISIVSYLLYRVQKSDLLA
ncbi:MAG: LVIVD repeat-containing protein [Promethearchaeota archaeon]